MLTINADDWGRSHAETDAALRCHEKGRITSVSAMLFMKDSARAAALARENKINTGLHLNFSEPFTGDPPPAILVDYHRKISAFLTRNKYAQLVYNPSLREAFACSCRAQLDEFVRLYEKSPAHIDGHHHLHLCANIVLSDVIPRGMRIRPNFSFRPHEKSFLNRGYRHMVDGWLARKYRLTDYFFDLTQCIEEKKLDRVLMLARSSNVELMTHPVIQSEMEYLMGDRFHALLEGLRSVPTF
jgi:predicted glycoside hydrolase/deacetylase ChbG (UPF0249 family)